MGSQERLGSRSHWYSFLQAQYGEVLRKLERIRMELVDPAYNSLSIRVGEVFVSDSIPVVDVPGVELVVWVLAHEREPEIQICHAILRSAQFVYSLGTEGLLRWAWGAAV